MAATGLEPVTLDPQSSCGSISTESVATDKSSGLKFYQGQSRSAKAFNGVIFLFSIATLLFAFYTYRKTTTSLFYFARYSRSCTELNGPTGIYKIQTHPYFKPYPVYCDMDTDGGGWTLVASIHENNIDGKCTLGDKWSSEQGFSLAKNYNGSRSWENTNIFGNIESLTSDDYKNSAYYELKASNAMIWHLPNQLDAKNFSKQAFLKYYTTNNFLSSYGGTLQAMYQLHVPLVHAGSYRFFTLLAQPVIYEKGDNDTVMRGIPFDQRDFVQPGFVQFRAFDSRGFPNALCPGIRMVAGDSSRVCVGGGGTIAEAHFGYRRKITKSTCGDFAGWAGDANDGGSQEKPSKSGRSLIDINSSLFIFVR